VTDFLMEEVLRRQPPAIQDFLLRTSILDRFCGPLCDAVLSAPSAAGQETLECLERANLFIVPLDDERRWYRYHGLFADLLRQRLNRSAVPGAAELHAHAARWYEDHGLEIDAFRHAAAAGDMERVERLIEGKGRPLYFRGAAAPVLRWIESLPVTAMDGRPSLWVTYASALMLSGRPTRVEEKLVAAEAALAKAGENAGNLGGRIAALRAIAAVASSRAGDVPDLSRRALELLRPDDAPFRALASLARAYACQLRGDLAAAVPIFAEVESIGRASGNSTLAVAAAAGLGQIREAENELHPAAEAYRGILDTVDDPEDMYNYAAHLGLARICYEWNDLDAAWRHAQQSARLAPLIECESTVPSLLLQVRVLLARADDAGAASLLSKADEAARRHPFADLGPEVAAARVPVLLRRGEAAAAARLSEKHGLSVSRVRVFLAQGNAAAALAALDPPYRQAQAVGPENERLRLRVLRALILRARGEKDESARLLEGTLAMAEPGGFIRLFLDEGAPMARLLSEASARGVMPDYTGKLLAAFDDKKGENRIRSALPFPPSDSPPAEALSERESEVLALIARGFSNHQIAERLFLALSTVKGHNQSIFGKLRVRRRTEAIARARELGLL
jgi:LuxR family transcriptional regulator, maltose regulon positive regulatory protein